MANARLYTQANRRLSQLQALRRIDVAIATSPLLQQSLPVLLEQILEQLALDAAGVLLLEPETQTLNFAAGRGFRSKACTAWTATARTLPISWPSRIAMRRWW